MPFDLYGDTFGGNLYGRPPNLFPTPRQPVAAPSVLPQDESTLLGGMMERGLGGLAYLGKVLDKTFGGRAVRGTLGGNPRELLSVLPFSDTLGLTDETQTVHGKDLLTQAGFLTPGDDGWENTVAGLGADIALDPAMWFGAAVPKAVLGGLKSVGQPLAQGAGNVVQRATFGMVNPYTAAQKIGDNASRIGSALFEVPVHGAWMKDVQQLSRDRYHPSLVAGQQAAENARASPLVDLAPFARQVGDEAIGRGLGRGAEGMTGEGVQSLIAAGLNPFDAMSAMNTGQKYADTVRQTRLAENAKGIATPEVLNVPKWQTEANERLVHGPARVANTEATRLDLLAQKTNDPGDVLAAAYASSEAQRLGGLPAPFDISGAAEYFPRTPSQWLGLEGKMPTSGGVSGGLSAKGGPLTQREDFLRGLPGGTEGINGLVRDANFAGRNRTMNDLQVEDALLRRTTGHGSGAMPQGFAGDELAWAGAREQAKTVSDWLRELPPQALEHGMFSPDFVGAGFKRLNDSARMQASADAVTEGAKLFARPVAVLEAANQRYVRVSDMLNEAGLTHIDPATGEMVAHANVAQAFGLKAKDLENMAVPADVAQDMARLGRAYTTPGVLAPVVEWWDKVANLFRNSLTTPFPGFHFRNLMSGGFNTWRDGSLSTTAAKEAFSVLRGGGLSPEVAGKLFPGMSVEAANQQLLKEVIANKVAFTRDSRQVSETVGAFASREGGMLPSQVPDMTRLRSMSEDIGGFLEGFKGGGPKQTTWREPLAQQGVRGDVTRFVPVERGQVLGGTVEDFNRLNHYIGRRLNGSPVADSSLAVKKYHFDYSDLTEFEKSVMKRIFPWYSFSRKNLPPLLADLAEKPAKLAATTRLVTGTRTPGEFVPPWIAEGAATPIEGGPEGQKRFISSFGLPMEDELVKTIGALAQGDIGRTFQQAFGMSQPFVKLPAELATGTQMYSGRKLEDLRPYEFATLGGLVPEDVARQASQVIANTPLSRFGSTLDKFIDERKDLGTTLLNTATGVRVTDVDVDKIKERAAQEQLKKMLRGQPGVKARDEVYVPREQLPLLSEDDAMTYSLLKEIERRTQQRNREAKKAGQ